MNQTNTTDETVTAADATATWGAWTIGLRIKTGIWSTYISINYAGAAYCIYTINIILKKEKKTATDVFAIFLLVGCIMMSIPCASQCLINAARSATTFQFGIAACDMEAFFHVSAIMMQFHSTALIAWARERTVALSIATEEHIRQTWWIMKMYNTVPTSKSAIIISSIFFVIAEVGTYVIGRYSTIYLMPAGAYCFYKFTSPVMALWFIPTLLLCSICICVWYYRIYKIYKLNAGVAPTTHTTHTTHTTGHMSVQTVITITMLAIVLVLFVGWFPALVGTIYELTVGRVPEWLDMFVGIDGSMHTLLIPTILNFDRIIWNRRLNRARAFLCCSTAPDASTEVTRLSSDKPPHNSNSKNNSNNNSNNNKNKHPKTRPNTNTNTNTSAIMSTPTHARKSSSVFVMPPVPPPTIALALSPNPQRRPRVTTPGHSLTDSPSRCSSPIPWTRSTLSLSSSPTNSPTKLKLSTPIIPPLALNTIVQVKVVDTLPLLSPGSNLPKSKHYVEFRRHLSSNPKSDESECSASETNAVPGSMCQPGCVYTVPEANSREQEMPDDMFSERKVFV